MVRWDIHETMMWGGGRGSRSESGGRANRYLRMAPSLPVLRTLGCWPRPSPGSLHTRRMSNKNKVEELLHFRLASFNLSKSRLESSELTRQRNQRHVAGASADGDSNGCEHCIKVADLSIEQAENIQPQ